MKNTTQRTLRLDFSQSDRPSQSETSEPAKKRKIPAHIQRAKERGDTAFLARCGRKAGEVRRARKAHQEDKEERLRIEIIAEWGRRKDLISSWRMRREANEHICPLN